MVASSYKAYSSYSFKIWDLNNNFKLKYEFFRANGELFFTSSFVPLADGYLWMEGAMMVWDINKKAFINLIIKPDEVAENFISINQTHFAVIVNNNANQALLRIYKAANFKSYVREYFVAQLDGLYLIAQMRSMDENYVAVTFGYSNFSILFININNGNKKCFFSSSSHLGFITSIVSIGSGRFASGGEDGLIKIWDANACSLLKTFELGQTIGKLTLIDGAYLASMTSEFKVWDLNSLTLRYSFVVGSNVDLGYFKL